VITAVQALTCKLVQLRGDDSSGRRQQLARADDKQAAWAASEPLRRARRDIVVPHRLDRPLLPRGTRHRCRRGELLGVTTNGGGVPRDISCSRPDRASGVSSANRPSGIILGQIGLVWLIWYD